MAKEYRARGSAPKSDPPKRGPKGPPRLRWVFHGPPVTAPGGSVPFMVPEELADDLARHLERLSFWSKDDLVDMADSSGMLNVNALPDRVIRHDPPAEEKAEIEEALRRREHMKMRYAEADPNVRGGQ